MVGQRLKNLKYMKRKAPLNLSWILHLYGPVMQKVYFWVRASACKISLADVEFQDEKLHPKQGVHLTIKVCSY